VDEGGRVRGGGVSPEGVGSVGGVGRGALLCGGVGGWPGGDCGTVPWCSSRKPSGRGMAQNWVASVSGESPGEGTEHPSLHPTPLPLLHCHPPSLPDRRMGGVMDVEKRVGGQWGGSNPPTQYKPARSSPASSTCNPKWESPCGGIVGQTICDSHSLSTSTLTHPKWLPPWD
jgi:hypothetical protein